MQSMKLHKFTNKIFDSNYIDNYFDSYGIFVFYSSGRATKTSFYVCGIVKFLTSAHQLLWNLSINTWLINHTLTQHK